MNKQKIDMIKYTIGEEYVNGSFENENNLYMKLQYDLIKRVTDKLFNYIPYKIVFTKEDPYESAKEMRAKVKETGVIKIYTEYGGHPFLNKEENARFRAVHDVWAHLVCGCPFTFEGEYTAYLEQRKYYPVCTWRTLFAEIPAQTCAYYYTDSFDFKQRAIESPQRWLELCEGIERDYSHNSILKPILSDINSLII